MEDVGAGVGAQIIQWICFVLCFVTRLLGLSPIHAISCVVVVSPLQDVWFPAGTKCMARLHHIHHHHGDPERRPS